MDTHRFNGLQGGAKVLGLFAVLCLALLIVSCGKDDHKPTIALEPLPYEMDTLMPYISAQALSIHYDKHYGGYVDKANALLKGSAFEGQPADKIMASAAANKEYTTIFNNVAQAWNHAFFWKCLKPGGGGLPGGDLAELIKKSFGDFDAFKQKFLEAAKDQFGSGWTWLVFDGEELQIITTANADTPIAHGLQPIFTVDVWEHAYYLDYQNRRTEYLENVLSHLADWEFVASQLKPITPATHKERPLKNVPFRPITVTDSDFNPRNT
jgi:Fe-Mn family superoxide dismutase